MIAGCSLLLSDDLEGGPASPSPGAPTLDGSAPNPEASEAAVVAEGDSGAGSDGGGCDADLTSSPTNCGACGRVCDGVCAAGVCGPRLEAEVTGLTGLSATPTSVAWTTPTALAFKLPDAGTIFPIVGITTSPGITYGSGGIFVGTASGSAGTVRHCRETGACSRPQMNISPLQTVLGELGNFQMVTTGGALYSCTQTDCSSTNLLAPKSDGPFVDLAVLGGRIYWVTGENDGKVRSSPRTPPAPVDGAVVSEVTDLATGVPAPRGLAADSLGVVWTESGSGNLRRCAPASDGTCTSPPTTVFAGAPQDAPTRVVSDGAHVYWIASTARRVLRCPASGCTEPPVVVMDGLADPQRIALTLTRVYVADLGTSRVLSAPK